MLHPLIARMIERAYRRGHGELAQEPLEKIREYYQSYAFPKLSFVQYEEIEIKSGLRMRLHYWPSSKKNLPLVLYLRASAHVLGEISDSDYFCALLSKYLRCHVAALEPRLSPEYKFPIGFEDCIASIEYLVNNATKCRINPKKIVLWGESSGGNLAAALSHYFKNKENSLFLHQILFYPLLDYSEKEKYSSKSLYGKGFMMDNTLTDWFMKQYVKSPEEFWDLRISPLLDSSFEGLPATTLIGAQYDPMRDEGNSYCEKLIQAKVKVNGLILPGMIHGFLWYASKLPAAKTAQKFAADVLKETFR